MAKTQKGGDTPLMTQYRTMKTQHPDALLFFRMGDFYELFDGDAVTAARVLGITLTSRNNGAASTVPLAGVPVKAAPEYLRRLVEAGYRVAVAEQMEDPALAVGLVRRAVVEVVTPGAAIPDVGTDRASRLCVAVADPDPAGPLVGLAASDLSTGELALVLLERSELQSALDAMTPREVLTHLEQPLSVTGAVTTLRPRWEFDGALGGTVLTRQYGVASLESFGLGEGDAPVLAAASALLSYFTTLQPNGLSHMARPTVRRPGGTMPLDEMTRRNLEIVESLRGGESGTLLEVLDRTVTPAGGRLLRRWLLEPLTTTESIDDRLNAVDALVSDTASQADIRTALSSIRDIERLAVRAASGRASARELRTLGDSLAALPALESALRAMNCRGCLESIVEDWDPCAEIAGAITGTLTAAPPSQVGEDEPTIAPGVNAELDELRALQTGGHHRIAALQAAERERTGISTLKIGYTRVFGYYIEVTKSHEGKTLPSDYQRRQTLAGAERYTMPALSEMEAQVLGAGERLCQIERTMLDGLRQRVGAAVSRLQCLARALAELDVLSSLADAAVREGYVRPLMHTGFELDIQGGRHPVVERMMAREQFIPNDVVLTQEGRFVLLTGPNMAGKSTVLRQTGLVVLMAHVGSFVPASTARVPLTDRIFTRVGASDNLVRGQSTFMVEMTETSAILHGATRRSLVLLDEIGRGTSTYDGLSIAWAVSEHLHDTTGCKALFATHYHELVRFAADHGAARTMTVDVREVGDTILFLHRLIPGAASRSYGIDVARIAGLPPAVVARARDIVRTLECAPDGPTPAPQGSPATSAPPSPVHHPLVDRLAAMDANTMTPLAALTALAEIIETARRGR